MLRRQPRSPLFPYTTLFFFNDTATTEIYTLSLHDALPIYVPAGQFYNGVYLKWRLPRAFTRDRKSTRLNSSHQAISYAVFCLEKKKKRLDFTQHTSSHTGFLHFTITARVY